MKKEIEIIKEEINNIIVDSTASSREVIARYTAAVAVNFTDWIGKTIPWVRHENSYFALVDNLRCESKEDHVGMLLNFAELSDALPDRNDFSHIKTEVEEIRNLFKDPYLAGLRGLILCAILENTSEIFIPDMASKAIELGCSDMTYTNTHGIADIEHSLEFIKALDKEIEMGYENVNGHFEEVAKAVTNLIQKIYS